MLESNNMIFGATDLSDCISEPDSSTTRLPKLMLSPVPVGILLLMSSMKVWIGEAVLNHQNLTILMKLKKASDDG